MLSWLKMREDLHEDPAVLRIAQTLNIRPEHVVGYCHRFWGWVSRQCHDGTVTGVTLVSIGNIINLPGFPELLCEAGWLEYDESGVEPIIRIPKFERHLSEGAKSRALASERQKNKRSKTSRTNRDETVTREEKRREEKNNKKPPPLLPLPDELDDTEFGDAWTEWQNHRREIKKKLTPTSTNRQIKKLAEMGRARAVAAIHHSIAKGYTGIYEPNGQVEKPEKFSGIKEFLQGGDNDTD